MDQFPFDVDGQRITATMYPARKPLGLSLLCGPGSDGTQRHPFVVMYATELARRGVLVVTYDFPYAVRGRRRPDPAEVLKVCCRAALVAARECRPKNRLFIGGKSLSANISSQVVADGGDDLAGVLGIVSLGFPLHPIGRRDKRRDGHLRRLVVPVFFAQGTRDVFGTPDELRSVVDQMPEGTELFPVSGGDHSFAVSILGKTPPPSAHPAIQDAIVQWMSRIAERGASLAPPNVPPIAPRLGDQLRSLHRRATAR